MPYCTHCRKWEGCRCSWYVDGRGRISLHPIAGYRLHTTSLDTALAYAGERGANVPRDPYEYTHVEARS